MRRSIGFVCAVTTVLAAGAVFAETCLSPYIKGLRQPERVMYLWMLPATSGTGPDYLSVIGFST